CSYVAPDGEIRGAFVGRKLEQYPEGFGTGCLVVGEQVADIVDRGRAILRSYGYHGISEVEFIWDPVRKDHLLLDVNPRVWKWIALPIASGVDLPWLAYSEAIGRGERAGAPRSEHRPLPSLWVAAMVVALPHALWSIAHLADVPCPPEHPPLGGSYYCVPPGAQVVLILSTITLAFALVGASSDARALATR